MAQRQVVVARIAPASAFRVALALSLVGLAAWILCVVVLYFGMEAAGVWDKANGIIGGIGGEEVISFGMVVSVAALFGAVFAILMTILAPIVALIYNAVVDLFGGIGLTLHT
ncbi:DUF3566 domain-containing protein [Corynebacterium uberis]|uniref:DUF3566 domain-containing protein n=1 Tax=Corynebacterium TaxID=1716 RepID=UPI001D09C0FE|nr:MULTISPECIES: DUF3566 domain-containing protein [Corynebacterium]MCZ9310140.1 DUF3566 domain-containing protein [Corynebacterium sp. c6VSa_13]UDL73281.1 DUF3566 domain-containing protein [Corynebacterium uberis]UDL75841.1 DUF3566 domain-containing protein [Corynebacterium uberis]UDL78054.1 DUF3566 domain-containing protein [Corynebacterium uberis]UDL80336.1 DUF3566 domain-containing protein [Corynebacterium uberis]